MELLDLICEGTGSYKLRSFTYSTVARSGDFCNYYLHKPELLREMGMGPLDYTHHTEMGACYTPFLRAPLSTDPFLLWPQQIIDATHYLRPGTADALHHYLRVRHAGWPRGELADLGVLHNPYWSPSGDLIVRYLWL